jgi:exopolysaccharide biosynthesis protein
MTTALTTEYYNRYPREYFSAYIKDRLENSVDLRDGVMYALVLFFIILTLNISRPIYATVPEYSPPIIKEVIELYSQSQFENDMIQKYKTKNIYFPADGIAHIKKTKYINSKPIKINIVEISTKANQNLAIKPKTAGYKLNFKSTVRKMAQRENAVVAINAGYFKPQTGMPLGALIIDGKILTGPIYNRVGIGIFEEDGKLSYSMDKVGIDIKAETKTTSLKIDNINQPRMSQNTVLLYTPDWGTMSPQPPKNGYNLLIKNNTIEKISANPIELSQGSYVVSASKDIISNFARNNKEVYINTEITGNLKGAKHIIAAGPYLVKNSQIFVDTKTQKFEAIAGKNPRSAIGYTSDNNLIIVTVDGREKASAGMTLNELAVLMKNLGCENAMNLDGGSSSAMFVKNKIVNDAINKEGALVSNTLVIKETEDNVQISSIE